MDRRRPKHDPLEIRVKASGQLLVAWTAMGSKPHDGVDHRGPITRQRHDGGCHPMPIRLHQMVLGLAWRKYG